VPDAKVSKKWLMGGQLSGEYLYVIEKLERIKRSSSKPGFVWSFLFFAALQ
jgi:hypothetical protein